MRPRQHIFWVGMFYAAALLVLPACSQNDVKEHFQSHGFSYPVDVSGVLAGKCKFVNIEQEELSTEESRRYVEDGIRYVRSYFQGREVRYFMKGVEALVIDTPVLYRNESGDVGLMVNVTGYGQGDPSGRTPLPVEWVSEGSRLWRTVNFTFFFRDRDYRWQYGGQVYEDGE